MNALCRSLAPASFAAVLALASFGSAVAQTNPVVGSENVATADPIVAPPPSTPCAVLVLGQT